MYYYAIIDCNNFYVSCERVFAPHLRNKPVVVLSNNDGCIISRSNEAKAIGVKMGMPYFKAIHLIKQHNIQVFSSNYTLYADMSDRVMQVLEIFTPDIEYYSIDEAFLKLRKTPTTKQLAFKMREKVISWTGIPVSIGIGKTKTLAKVASLIAKKQGVYIIDEEDKIKVLKETDTSDIWGVGRRWDKLLKERNINNAYDFMNLPDKEIRNSMKIIGLKTAWELRGIECINLEQDAQDKKSITVSRSFSKEISDFDELKEALINFCIRGGEKLRLGSQTTKHITVFIKTNRFKDTSYYSLAASTELTYPSDYTPDLIEAGIKALIKIFDPNLKYKKLGIYLNELSQKQDKITNLFEVKDNKKNTSLMASLDKINSKYGRKTVSYLGAGFDNKWVPKAQMCSKKFTTNWKDLIVAK